MTAAWSAMPPCSPPSASERTGDGACSASCDPSEAEVHWRAFLDSLIDRGIRGVRFVVSDDHAGLKAARRAVLPGAVWQRCQFHLAQNAIHHAPNAAIRKRIGAELRGGIGTPTSQQTGAGRTAIDSSPPAGSAGDHLDAGSSTSCAEGLAVLHSVGAALAAHAYREPNRAGHLAGDQTPLRSSAIGPDRDAVLRLASAVRVGVDAGCALRTASAST